MAGTTPLIGAPYPFGSDAVTDLLSVDDYALWAEKYANMRFASTAARDAAIPVPEAGMVAVIGTSAANRYWVWYDGANWVRLSPQVGTVNVVFTAVVFVSVVIVFPVPFAVTPIVTTQVVSASSSCIGATVLLTAVSATQFTARVALTASATVTPALHWTATTAGA